MSESTSAMTIVNTSYNSSSCLAKCNLCKSVGLSFPFTIVDIWIPGIDTSMRHYTIGIGRVDTSSNGESTNSFNTSFSSIGDYPDIVQATINKSILDRQTSFNLCKSVGLSFPFTIVDIWIPGIDTSMRHYTIGIGRVDT